VPEPLASIGVFGGSGLYSLLADVDEIIIETPYGPTSAPLHVGTVVGRRVAFLPRHGPHHEHPAHKVNYRANLWAMKEAGVGTLLAPCSAGSLQVAVEPGHFVVLDQFVDRTSGRADTFFDEGAHHTTMAHPYDRELGIVLAEACRAEGVAVHEGGTVVVIQGPRFSTMAESRWFGQMGWDVVNMTQYPEAALANELGIPYAGLALVTDYDAGLEGRDDIEPVTMEQVFAFFTSNIERVRGVLFRAIAALPG
jgi:5'-methylthioadenosine phosphorylase